tara:strand:- start:1832 stop:3331 length:1500 start_codon:yes stop_codon:yes gene_type:complete
MKTFNGTYGVNTEQSNSLVDNLLKYPEISKTLVRQHQRYSLTYLLERAGRFSNAKVLADNSYEWKVLGRTNKPLVGHGFFDLNDADAYTATQNNTQDVADTANEIFHVTFKNNSTNGHYVLCNRNDIVRFKSGATALVLSVIAQGSESGSGITAGDGYKVVKFRLISGDVNGSDIHGDVVAGTIASAFAEASLGSTVGQNQVYPDTYKNWLTISRKKKKVTGGQLSDVTWIENNGQALWYFTAEELMIQEFMYQLELQRWYGVRSAGLGGAVGAPGENTASTLTDADSSVVQTGDGILAQITGSNDGSYGSSLTEAALVDYMADLSKNATTAEGMEYVVMTGTEGRKQFHVAMKDLMVGPNTSSNGAGGAMIFDAQAGQDVELGVNFTSYNALGNKITLAHCPAFDDPNLHADPLEGGKMAFLDFSSQGDGSNIELVAKGAEGYNRNYIRKYVPGMVNPYDFKGMMAANGDDAFECHVMSESGIIVRNPLSCGIFSKTS